MVHIKCRSAWRHGLCGRGSHAVSCWQDLLRAQIVVPNLSKSLICLAISTLCVFAAHAQDSRPPFPAALIAAAIERTHHSVTYDGRYRSIDYPGGDVPADIGVCTDVIIRSYRKIGVDLQELVHLDMKRSFDDYPQDWGLSRPDPNIDHRRVPNLQRYFSRHGRELPVSNKASDYLPGDLVTWMLPGNLPHIGIVVDATSPDGERHLIVHNIGSGPKVEDVLFDYRITGHYRYDRRQ